MRVAALVKLAITIIWKEITMQVVSRFFGNDQVHRNKQEEEEEFLGCTWLLNEIQKRRALLCNDIDCMDQWRLYITLIITL